MLAVIESSYGSFAGFNAWVRGVFASRLSARLSHLPESQLDRQESLELQV